MYGTICVLALVCHNKTTLTDPGSIPTEAVPRKILFGGVWRPMPCAVIVKRTNRRSVIIVGLVLVVSCIVLPPRFVGDAGRGDDDAVMEVQTIIWSITYYRLDMRTQLLSTWI